MPFNTENSPGLNTNLWTVRDIQAEFLKRLEVREPAIIEAVPSLLPLIRDCNDEIIDLTLGKLGKDLKKLALGLDFEHPEAKLLFGKFEDKELSQLVREFILLTQFAKEKQLNKVIPTVSKVVTESLHSKIDMPISKKSYVRLLKNKEEREEVRSTRKMQNIDLGIFYRRGEEGWRTQPNSFQRFLRFDTSYKEEIEKAEKKAKRYLDLGCTSLAAEITRTIESFKENMDQAYFGFNRITITNVAIILAKSLGYNYIPSGYSWTQSDGRIVVSKNFFGKNFQKEESVSELVDFYSSENLEYEPRVYPLHDFIHIAPQSVIDTINLLDNFPDANNKPIFDHFGVIVPSVQVVAETNDGNKLLYTFKDEKGIHQIYNAYEDAVKQLDISLVKNACFHPVIVGERDGRCYFISYF